MIGAAAATSASPHPILDGVLALSLVVHSHIGVSQGGGGRGTDRGEKSLTEPCCVFWVYCKQFDAVLTDYLHKRKFPIWGPLMTWALRFTTAGALVGVYQFNTNDVGTCHHHLHRHFHFPFLAFRPKAHPPDSDCRLLFFLTGLTELVKRVWKA